MPLHSLCERIIGVVTFGTVGTPRPDLSFPSIITTALQDIHELCIFATSLFTAGVRSEPDKSSAVALETDSIVLVAPAAFFFQLSAGWVPSRQGSY